MQPCMQRSPKAPGLPFLLQAGDDEKSNPRNRVPPSKSEHVFLLESVMAATRIRVRDATTVCFHEVIKALFGVVRLTKLAR